MVDSHYKDFIDNKKKRLYDLWIIYDIQSAVIGMRYGLLRRILIFQLVKEDGGSHIESRFVKFLTIPTKDEKMCDIALNNNGEKDI